MCWVHHLMDIERPIQTLTGLTIKECQLKCQANPQCNFFKSVNSECSLWKTARKGCDNYLGVSNSILKTCGKGDQIFHFCKCNQILFHFTPTKGLWDYHVKPKLVYFTVKISIYIKLFLLFIDRVRLNHQTLKTL